MGWNAHQIYGYFKMVRHLRFFSIYLGIVLFSIPFLHAQTSTVAADFYSLNDGLSDRLVTDIIQSDDQMIWIGTSGGLNKFNGYEFTVFNNFPGNENQISHDDIMELGQDKNGNIVILYRNIPNIFDLLNPITHQLQSIELTVSKGIDGMVRDIHINRQGEIFILTILRSSLHVYHFKGEGQIERVLKIDEVHLDLTVAASLLTLSDGRFLINEVKYGLRLFDQQGALVKAFTGKDFEHTKKPFPYPNPDFFLFQDRSNKVWLSLYHTPMVFLLDENALSFYPAGLLPKDKYFTHIWEDQVGNLLFAHGNNNKLDPTTLGLYYVTLDNSVQDYSYLLKDGNKISAAFGQDFSKTIFLGVKEGFKIIRNSQSDVKTFLTQDLAGNKTLMRGITGDGYGQVYLLAENDHIYAYDLKTHYLDTLPMIDAETGKYINYNCASELFYDPRGYLWASTCHLSNYGKLLKYDLATCEAKSYPADVGFNAMAIDAKGLIWVATTSKEQIGQLMVFDPIREEFQNYQTPDGETPFSGMTANYLYFDRMGHLWIGTDSGVLKLETSTGHHEHFSIDNPADQGQLSHNTCYVILEDNNGIMWLGTKNGLNALDPITKKVEVYTKKDGMSSNTIYGLLEDGDLNLWISTLNGLTHFDKDEKLFRNFYALDGFSDDEFTRFSFYKDEYGQCYFGTTNGVNTFYPEDILVDKKIPKVILTKIERFDAATNRSITQDTNLVDITTLTINPGDSYFTLHFALPVYYGKSKNKFRSKLENYEPGWSELSTNGILRYYNLPPGEYLLKVKGADSNGNWSKEEYHLNIKVEQYFYKKPQFWFLIFLVVVAIIYALLKNRLEQKLRMERLRMKLSSDLHDEVSGLLSGIAMQSDMLRMMIADNDLTSRLKTIGEASRKAMSKMSDVIWSIDSRKDRLEDLIERMYVHADEVLLPIDIRYDFKIGKMERQQKIPANIRQDIYFIYKEAINNIAKHSKANKVQINMENLGNLFQLTVADNGEIIAPSIPETNGQGNIILGKHRKKSGQGLTNMKMRAQRLKAELKIGKQHGFMVQLQMRRFAK